MKFLKKAAISGTLFAATLGGGALGASMINSTAGAQTNTSTTTTAAPATSGQAAPDGQAGHGQQDPSRGGHAANGVTEKLLTGSAATNAKVAALRAVPGGAVERVENDAEGAAYEAHVKKADGSDVTVKMDASFKVTETINGHG